MRRSAVVLLIALALAGCASKGKVPAVAGTGAAVTSTTAAPTTTTAAPTTTTTIPVVNLSGTGQQATQQFAIAGGLAVFHSTCASCQANFSVTLDDSAGKEVDLLANTIGSFDGSKGEHLSSGRYLLNVQADAAWTVVVDQPRNPPLTPLPQTYTGSGDKFVGPFDAAHAVRLRAHNVGPGNFSVTVLDAQGDDQDLAFNEIGNFDGSNVSNMISRGPYFLDVVGGTWTLDLSAP